jgi:hypothetical protein
MLGNPFLCKGPSFTSVKLIFSVSVQTHFLEVGSPGDVDILSRTPLHIVFLFDLFFFFSFLRLLYYCENFIELNYLPLPLHFNTKPQIDLYISTLDSLHSCTILAFKYHHFKVYQCGIKAGAQF